MDLATALRPTRIHEEICAGYDVLLGKLGVAVRMLRDDGVADVLAPPWAVTIAVEEALGDGLDQVTRRIIARAGQARGVAAAIGAEIEARLVGAGARASARLAHLAPFTRFWRAQFDALADAITPAARFARECAVSGLGYAEACSLRDAIEAELERSVGSHYLASMIAWWRVQCPAEIHLRVDAVGHVVGADLPGLPLKMHRRLVGDDRLNRRKLSDVGARRVVHASTEAPNVVHLGSLSLSKLPFPT